MDKASLQNFIETNPLFSLLTAAEKKILEDALIYELIPPHTVFIEQDDDSQTVYFIYEGTVRVYRISESGEEINIAVMGKGDIAGEMAVVNKLPRSANVETIQETSVLKLSCTAFENLMKKNAAFSYAVLQNISAKLQVNVRKIENMRVDTLKERTLETLQQLSAYFTSEIPLSQEELATIVGASRARVTEALAELREENKVTLSHRSIKLH